MAISCDPEDLAAGSVCYCFDNKTAESVKLYLLAVIAELDDMTQEELAEAAKCYCFDKYTAKKVEMYLLCQIANSLTPA